MAAGLVEIPVELYDEVVRESDSYYGHYIPLLPTSNVPSTLLTGIYTSPLATAISPTLMAAGKSTLI